jgi:hypothetical protein
VILSDFHLLGALGVEVLFPTLGIVGELGLEDADAVLEPCF